MDVKNVPMSQLRKRIQSLRTLFPFDAVQLLACTPDSGTHLELHCEGYNADCARALGTVFPQIYPPGFTAQASPLELLPPSISECSDVMHPPFRKTSVYMTALQRDGFEEGMTMELRQGEGYLGLAHFSSRQAGRFDTHVRTLARGAKVLLEDAIENLLLQSGTVLHWVPLQGELTLREEMVELARPFSPTLLQALSFLHSQPSVMEAYWLEGRRSYKLTARRLPAGDIVAQLEPTALPAGLSAKEMQVLGWLMAGYADRDIAAHLFISERTVHSHVATLLRKLGVVRRAQAAVEAALNHWYVPDARGAILRAVPRLCH